MLRLPHVAVGWTLFVLIAGSYALMALQFPVAYVWATYEDLFGEWGQTYFFGAACLLSAQVALDRASRYRWFFALLALALFYTFMEEISWGQRVFGFASPEFFRENNLQRETNLHNVLVGPYSTNLKALIEVGLAGGLVLFGCVYPLLLRLGLPPARWADRLGVPAPPLYLAPFFLVAGWLELTPFRFNEAEVAEMLVGLALAIMALHYRLAARRQFQAPAPPRPDPAASAALAKGMLVLVLGVALLASATTYAFWQSDSRRAAIENRLLNGYEKFAGRYQRYDRIDEVIQLYLRVLDAEPERTSVMRRLARAYREVGDEDNYRRYANMSLKQLLAVQARNPNKVSNNLYLSLTYRLLDDEARAREYGERAHRIAQQRATENPGNLKAAYWLGKTYRHLGDYESAREQFRIAFEGNPGSSKYRDAYYDMIKVTGGEL